MRVTQLTIAALLVLLSSAVARAGGVHSRRGGINRVHKGLNEIGIQSLGSLSQVSQDEQTSSQFFGLAGMTFRHFLKDNMAVTVNGSYLYRSPGDESTEQGGMLVGSAHYYQRLGEGMFVAPGMGLGLVLGDRNVSLQDGAMFRKDPFFGGVVRMQLPVVLYAWDKFNVLGGPELMATLGATSPEEAEGSSFLRVDAGFSVGASMYF